MTDSDLNKKSASMNIQIEAIVPKTQKVHGDTNQETKKVAVQINIVEVEENVTNEPCCTPTTGPIPCQIFKWIWKIIKWIANLFFLLMSCLLLIVFAFYLLAMPVWLFWVAWTALVQTYIAISFLSLITALSWLVGVVFCLKEPPCGPWRELLMESLKLLKC